jgi:hypothetical protein
MKNSPWDDRPKDADYVAEPHWRSQPATVSKPEKSNLRAIQRWVSAQMKPGLSSSADETGAQLSCVILLVAAVQTPYIFSCATVAITNAAVYQSRKPVTLGLPSNPGNRYLSRQFGVDPENL